MQSFSFNRPPWHVPPPETTTWRNKGQSRGWTVSSRRTNSLPFQSMTLSHNYAVVCDRNVFTFTCCLTCPWHSSVSHVLIRTLVKDSQINMLFRLHKTATAHLLFHWLVPSCIWVMMLSICHFVWLTKPFVCISSKMHSRAWISTGAICVCVCVFLMCRLFSDSQRQCWATWLRTGGTLVYLPIPNTHIKKEKHTHTDTPPLAPQEHTVPAMVIKQYNEDDMHTNAHQLQSIFKVLYLSVYNTGFCFHL